MLYNILSGTYSAIYFSVDKDMYGAWQGKRDRMLQYMLLPIHPDKKKGPRSREAQHAAGQRLTIDQLQYLL